MFDFNGLGSSELLAVGRRAFELCARRFYQLAGAADRADAPLRDILRRMAMDAELQAAEVEQQENLLTEDSGLSSKPEEGMGLIRSYLTSLSKPLGEGPLHRDIALFFAESLEEEASRFCRVLAGHARESRIGQLFAELAEREQGRFRYLREVVLEG